MARLNRVLVAEREAFVLESFRAGKSVVETNEALFAKYGKRMAGKRLYELRKSLAAPIAPAPEAPVSASAETGPAATPASAAPIGVAA